jgi:hypothetical protein
MYSRSQSQENFRLSLSQKIKNNVGLPFVQTLAEVEKKLIIKGQGTIANQGFEISACDADITAIASRQSIS